MESGSKFPDDAKSVFAEAPINANHGQATQCRASPSGIRRNFRLDQQATTGRQMTDAAPATMRSVRKVEVCPQGIGTVRPSD